MATPFLSSEEYDERAHQLYNEGQYDEALDVLREGLALYPNSVELHIGVGYARLAREEFAWARRSFEEALVLEPEHEDALAGLGETLLKFGPGRRGAALLPPHARARLRRRHRSDAPDRPRAVPRRLAARRRELFDGAKEFFEIAVQQAPESAEAIACVGYAQHRLGDDDAAIAIAAAVAAAGQRARRSAHLPREHPVRSRRVRGGALSLRADDARGSLGRARDLAAHRAEARARTGSRSTTPS